MLKVKDIMTTEVVTINGDAKVLEAIRLMKEKGLRCLIVSARDADDAYGIITETDIVYGIEATGRNAKEVKVHEIMKKPCIVVNPDLQVKYCARLFANTHIRRAPVIQGKLMGIVSVTDILRKAMI